MKRSFSPSSSLTLSFLRASPKRPRYDSMDTQPGSTDSEVSDSEFDICLVVCSMCAETDTFDSLDGAYENGWHRGGGAYCPEHAEIGILYEDGDYGITRKEFAQVCVIVDEIVNSVLKGI